MRNNEVRKIEEEGRFNRMSFDHKRKNTRASKRFAAICLTFTWNDDIYFFFQFIFGKFLISKGKGGKMIILHKYQHCVIRIRMYDVRRTISFLFLFVVFFPGEFYHEIYFIHTHQVCRTTQIVNIVKCANYLHAIVGFPILLRCLVSCRD